MVVGVVAGGVTMVDYVKWSGNGSVSVSGVGVVIVNV